MTARQGVDGRKPELKSVNYILVKDIYKYIHKTKKIGGSIIQPKQEVPGLEWIAH